MQRRRGDEAAAEERRRHGQRRGGRTREDNRCDAAEKTWDEGGTAGVSASKPLHLGAPVAASRFRLPQSTQPTPNHYRGNASGSPPSTGSTAPVVGVRALAKNTTASPTCRGSTGTLSSERSR